MPAGAWPQRLTVSYQRTLIRWCSLPGERGRAARRGRSSHGQPRSTLPGWLRVGPSLLEGAGSGVFALRDIPRGALIVACTGRFVPTDDQSPSQALYSFEYHSDEHMSFECHDEADTNIARFINSAAGVAGVEPNVKVMWHGNLLVVEAARHIRAGDELYLDYSLGKDCGMR